MADNAREIYQQNLELEMLTESRWPKEQWWAKAQQAAGAYEKAFRSDPFAYEWAVSRMTTKVYSIAEVLRAAKEGWAL